MVQFSKSGHYASDLDLGSTYGIISSVCDSVFKSLVVLSILTVDKIQATLIDCTAVGCLTQSAQLSVQDFQWGVFHVPPVFIVLFDSRLEVSVKLLLVHDGLREGGCFGVGGIC